MPKAKHQLDGHDVAKRLNAALSGIVFTATDEWVEVDPARIAEALRWLRDDPEMDAAQLSCLTAVDKYDRFEVVYWLQSMDNNHQIEVKAVLTDHEAPSLPSCYSVYTGALLQELETYDLMGIRFEGHPELKRLFLWEGFPGFPLRKDFLQLQGRYPGLPQFPYEQKGVQVR
jgi:NADH-quinone oxidoreductase subunit C